jgi:TusA-related sulfurtransferase
VSDVTAKEKVDARGLVCPMPTLRLSQAIKRIAVGEIVELISDDPGSPENMTAWTKNTGQELVSSTVDGKISTYYVRKKK